MRNEDKLVAAWVRYREADSAAVVALQALEEAAANSWPVRNLRKEYKAALSELMLANQALQALYPVRF